MFVSPWDLALVHLDLGDKRTGALAARKSCWRPRRMVVRLGVDPALGSLRAEPRFTKLQLARLRRAGVTSRAGLNGAANRDYHRRWPPLRPRFFADAV